MSISRGLTWIDCAAVLPDLAILRHNPWVPIPFPELSRKPEIPTDERTLDPTLRDPMENGMEATQAQWTRLRREWDYSYSLVTTDDRRLLRDFVKKLVAGADSFLYTIDDDPTSPEVVEVRFASLPRFKGKDNTANGKRYTLTFTLREV